MHYRISTTANYNEGGDSSGALPVNQWCQVACLKAGNKLRLYFNGVQDSEVTLSGTSVANTGPLYLGKSPWYAGTLARLDDLRIYARALTSTEIAGLTPQLKRRYTYGHDLISVTEVGPSTVTHYYGYDGHGSVRFLTDSDSGASTAITDTYDYDAWGQLLRQQVLDNGNLVDVGGGAPVPTFNPYRYAGEQWDNDLGMYYLRARYLNPNTGRFWTMDSYEGSSSDPLTLHKYLYAHGNPVNGWDPSGNNFIQTMAAGILSAGLSAMSWVATAAASGYAEATLFMIGVGYMEAYETGGWQGVAVVGTIEAMPIGRVVRFFPSWLKRSQMRNMANVLHIETRNAVATAGWKAAASGLRFKQTIKQGTLAVKGMGVKGADVTATAIVNGRELSLGRDLYALQGNLSAGGAQTLLDTLRKKAKNQLQGFAIREIQVEITDVAKQSSADWLRIVREQVTKFQQEVADVTVWLVDSGGNDIGLH